jgi:1-acyl-sn-glycerol-3-phosphate acyltransferase
VSIPYTLVWLAGRFLIASGMLKIYGQENLSDLRGIILAANHQSYLDPPIVGISLKRPAYFMAKAELFRFKPLGWLLGKLNTVSIQRGIADLQAYKKAIKLLLSGQALIIFPEGTRSRGDRFLEPKLGVGLLAKEARVPIVPVYLENTKRFCRWFFKKRITVEFGAPLEVCWLDKIRPDRTGYQQIAQEVMRRIESLRQRREEERKK